MYCTELTAAGVTIALETPQKLAIPERFRPFLGGAGEERYTLTFRETDALPQPQGSLCHADAGFRVWRDGGAERRTYLDERLTPPDYAVLLPDWAQRRGEVLFLAPGREILSGLGNAMFHIGLESLLMSCGRLLLHAALVETAYGGLLFSGVSGVGKSTQAALWEQCGGGRQLNGDRPVLYEASGRWYGHGSPYAGSSRCYENAAAPLRAIFLLAQAEENRAERVDAAAAFRRVYANTIINPWSPAYVARAAERIAALTASVPVYRLRCTPDVRAVETVRALLKGGG